MNIIVPGNKEQLNKMFYCKACGCIFEVNLSEYEETATEYNKYKYKCKCPTCNNWASEPATQDDYYSIMAKILREKLKEFRES